MGILISQEDLITLKENYSMYQTASKSGFVKNYSIEIYRKLIDLYKRNISEQHSFSHWCGDCRFDLVLRLYNWALQQEQFNNYINSIEEQAEEVSVINVETPETLPIPEEKDYKQNPIVEIKKKKGRPKKIIN
jgi:hypothetical protein